MNWLKRRQQTNPSQKIVNIQHGITLEVWQSRPEFVKWARDLFLQPMGNQLLSALRNETPVPVNSSRPEFDLGRVVGFTQAVHTLALLASDPVKPPTEVPVEYTEEPEIET